MLCPICYNTLIELSNNLYLCNDCDGVHVFLSQNSIVNGNVACSLLCIYPEKYEDNLYVVTIESESQDASQMLVLPEL